MSEDHICSEDVVFDRMSIKEKEQIFAMGFVPDIEHGTGESTSDEKSSASEVDENTDEFSTEHGDEAKYWWSRELLLTQVQ